MHLIRKLEDIEHEKAVKMCQDKIKTQIIHLQQKQDTEYKVMKQKVSQ